MGYYSRYTGRIDIDPPLTRKMFRDSPSYPGKNFRSDVRLLVEVHEVETDEGLMLRERAFAVVPASEDSFQGYDMVEHLQAVVDLADPTVPTAFTGRIDAVGADGEQWRIKVVDGQVRRFEPIIVWPMDSE
jgi:hypothetical protein